MILPDNENARRPPEQARGFGDGVNFPVLAKLMRAERFMPRPKGYCGDLAALEAATVDRSSRE
jgi:hypothetical protein